MGNDKGLLEPGTVLDNRYEVVRLLGEGGMATIYLVRHLGLQSQHALKVPDAKLFQSADARQRFATEGRLQASLSHPHIAQVTDIVVSPVPGLVLEYVEGGTLGELCAQSPGGRLELSRLRELFPPVLGAMEKAHAHRVVHRDLTPGNILLSKDVQGRLHPKVTDFGIAKVEEQSQEKYRTRTGVLLGTRPYMSPEQIRGAAEVDARTDIFALGAILYEAVTGRVAFDADSDFEMMKRITEGQYTSPEQVVPGLPEGLVRCIRKALAVEPAERFQDCAAFRAALEQALEEKTVPAPAPAPAPVPAPPARRRSPVALSVLGGLSGGLFLVLVLTLAILVRMKEEEGRLRRRQQKAEQANQQLQQERDIAVRQRNLAESRAGNSEVQAQNLQQAAQGVQQQLQEKEQLIQELQVDQKNILEAHETTLLEAAISNNLEVDRVVRTCNMTGSAFSYEVMEGNGDWSESMELEPRTCNTYHVKGYHPRVPVKYRGTLTQDVETRGEAMAAIVMGKQPDLEKDWKPWENQLVLGPDNSVQLKSVYVGKKRFPFSFTVQ
jgi:serine/threonine-protein kinase